MADLDAMAFVILRAVGLSATAALMGSAATARPVTASTALQRCGAATCLVVRGHRTDPSAPIRIAGHAVVVRGGRDWRVQVALADVRAWTADAARSVDVEVEGSAGGTTAATLPIGLLGHVTELAALDVSVRR